MLEILDVPNSIDQIKSFIGVAIGGLVVIKFMLPYIFSGLQKNNEDLETRIDSIEKKLENNNLIIDHKLDKILDILNMSNMKQAVLENDIENIKREIRDIKKEIKEIK